MLLNTEGANIPDLKRTLGLGKENLSYPILNTWVEEWIVTDNHPSALSQFTFRQVENMPTETERRRCNGDAYLRFV
jgi:hypothetical protein